MYVWGRADEESIGGVSDLGGWESSELLMEGNDRRCCIS